jgi:hypothetical protein
MAKIATNKFQVLHHSIEQLYARYQDEFGDIESPDSYRLYVPKYLLTGLQLYLEGLVAVLPENKITHYEGVPIVENWDNSIVLTHEDSLFHGNKSPRIMKITGLLSENYSIEKVVFKKFFT